MRMYEKYIKEYYKPKVSLEKQVELQNIKSSLVKNKAIRVSAHDLHTINNNSSGAKKLGINYERPWRAAIGTGSRGKSTKLGEKAYSLAGVEV